MKKVISLLAILCCIIVATGCTNEKTYAKEKNTTIMNEEVVFVKMPSPPKCKVIKDNENISKIVGVLDDAKKTKIDNKNENGWYILITVKNKQRTKQYTVIGNTLSVDGISYKVKDNFLTDLEAIYNEIDVKEQDYSS